MRAKLRRMATLAGVTLMMLGLMPAGSQAARAIQLITPYPAVSLEAGKSATFNLEVITVGRQKVALEVLESPPGWDVTLRGGGFIVNGVFGADEDPPAVQLNVTVPADAAKADYKVVLRATGGGGSDTLVIDIKVAEVVSGAATLTADFPTLRGASDSTFRFNLTLTNNTPEESTFNLLAQGPEGWKVEARPTAQAQASTVKVEGGGTSTVEVEADPPDTVTAGTYGVTVTAEAGAKRAEAPLTAEVVGNVRLELTTPNDRLNADAVAGKASDVAIIVENNGTTAVGEITLSASPPSGWEVTFTPETVERIDARQTAEVTAHITPSGEAVAGDYVLTLSAAGDGSSDDVEIRVTVEASRFWGIVGLLVIVGAVGILFRVFRQYGRR